MYRLNHLHKFNWFNSLIIKFQNKKNTCKVTHCKTPILVSLTTKYVKSLNNTKKTNFSLSNQIKVSKRISVITNLKLQKIIYLKSAWLMIVPFLSHLIYNSLKIRVQIKEILRGKNGMKNKIFRFNWSMATVYFIL